MLTVGSLFAGIGGWDLGLERAGMRCLWQCELDPHAIRVLEKHWPDVLRVRDVRDVNADTVPAVDLVCGGFPCQDISQANPKAVGIAGARSGLWSEMLRITDDLQPRYLLVENVPALLARGLDVVLGDLAAIGYDAEWDCLPASAFGAPHRRDRIWIVAYPGRERSQLRGEARDVVCAPRDAEGEGLQRERGRRAAGDSGSGRADVADAAGEGRAAARSVGPEEAARAGALGVARGSGRWEVEPDVGRVADGVPARLDRLRALGNALVPDVAEWIGRRVLEWEGLI